MDEGFKVAWLVLCGKEPVEVYGSASEACERVRSEFVRNWGEYWVKPILVGEDGTGTEFADAS